MRSEKFLGLSCFDSNILLRLYLTCTGYGRFEAGPISMVITLGMIDPDVNIGDRLEHLATLGFLDLYETEEGRYGQLRHYDADAPADLVRKRGPAILPAHPDAVADDMPNVRQPSAQRRVDKKRGEEKLAGPVPYGDD